MLACGALLAVILTFLLSILVYFFLIYKAPERINLLILGESGPGHAGETLTDTLIFVSIRPEGQTVLVSVPRDLWYLPWQTKINTLYYYGQQRGNGFGWTKQILGEILGQKVDRALLVDFKVFKDLVDLVDGVDVEVERTFDDDKYPLGGKENDLCEGDPEYQCRYERIHFEAGFQHFNGEQALKFVRSRYAEGEEGTDSARSARQQKVILALEKKISSPSIFLSPTKIVGLREIIQERIKSDLTRGDLLALGKMMLSSQARQLQSFVINSWQEESGLIYHPKRHASGQWVLLPKDSSWEELHRFIDCLLVQENKSACFPLQKQAAPRL